MAAHDAPAAIVALADARAAARRARDFTTADALKAQIEAAGWRVVDAASLYTLERVGAPDVVADGVIHYGSSAAVPSRLTEAPIGVASVVVVAPDDPAALGPLLRALIDHAPDGTQLVVVANDPGVPAAAELRELDAVDPGSPGVMTEVVWTSVRLGAAAARNAGIRRAVAPVVILLDADGAPARGLVREVVTALEDPGVAVAGPVGLLSDDLRTFRAAPPEAVDVVAIAGTGLGFRRADYLARGPLDEHFVVPDSLDVWWSLVLRDQGDDEPTSARPRRAVQVAGAANPDRRPAAAESADPEHERQAKRNFYRVLKRFATRRDLLAGGAGDGGSEIRGSRP